MNMKKHLIFFILIIVMGFYLIHPQSALSQSGAKVENINFYPEGSMLVVTYDIVKAKPGETFDVWIKIVTSSGKEISPNALTGNIESGNTGGTGKKITWDVEADRATLDEEFSVEVFAKPEKKTDKVDPVVKIGVAGSLTAGDVFTPEKNTFYWLGVDYSHVKMQVELEPEVVKNQFFNVWNDLFLKEADKYNIKEMLKLRFIQNDTRVINSVNAQADATKMKASNAPYYSFADISSFVSSYPSFNFSGIGILFIAEFLNRQENEGFYHVVAINLETKEVLLSERFRGEVGGAGFRNNWANSVFSVIEQFEKNYKNLKSKYSN
jgi:hypothetical protein